MSVLREALRRSRTQFAVWIRETMEEHRVDVSQKLIKTSRALNTERHIITASRRMA